MKTKILHKFIGSLVILLLSCMTMFAQTTLVNYSFNGVNCADPAIVSTAAGITVAGITGSGACNITATGTATGGSAFTANLTAGNRIITDGNLFGGENIIFQLGGAALPTYTSFRVYLQHESAGVIAPTLSVAWSTDAVTWNNTTNIGNGTSWSEDVVSFPIPFGETVLYFRVSSGFGLLCNFSVDNFQVEGNTSGPLPPGFAYANAGDDQVQCAASTINLQGNDPTPPVGYTKTVAWSCTNVTPVLAPIEWPTISPLNTAGAIATINTIYPEAYDYIYTFRYTITYNGPGGPYVTTDDIQVQNYRWADAAEAGNNQVLCIGTPPASVSTNFTGTNVAYGQGVWTQAGSNPAGATITNINDATSNVTFTQKGAYRFYWNTYNPNAAAGICPSVQDFVDIQVWQDVTANAGVDQEVCWAQTAVTLAATYTGDPVQTKWQTTGTGTFNDEFAPNAIYTLSAGDIATLHAHGTITLTWSVQGHIPPCGQASDFMVLTLENDPPIFTGAPYAGGNLELDANCEVTIPDATLLVTVADALPCTGPVTLTQSPVAGFTQPQVDEDPVVVVVTATDDAGNFATANVNYVAQDIIVPVWDDLTGTALDRTVTCDDATGLADAQALSPTATDNCTAAASIVVTKTPGVLVPGCASYTGTITNTFVAHDLASPFNYSSTYTQVITIIDTMKPVMVTSSISSCYDNAAAAEAAAIAATTVTDLCDPTPSVIAVATPDSDPLIGWCNSTVTVTATDDCLNTRSVTYNTRIDNTNPTIVPGTIATCYPDAASAEAAAIQAAKDAGTYDNCSDQADMTFAAVAAGTCAATVTLTVTDECGKFSTYVYNTRIDNTAPIITPDEVSVPSCFVTTADAYASILANTTAVDDCTTDPVWLANHRWIEKTNTGDDCNFQLTIYYIDEFCSNESSYTYTRRIDSIAPVFTGTPSTPITVDCNAVPAPPVIGVDLTANDNCMGDVTASITLDEISTQDPNPALCGHYNYTITRTWKANDGCTLTPLNEISFVQTINVQDTMKPFWAAFPADQTITAGCPFVEPAMPLPGELVADDYCAGTANTYVGYNGEDTVQMGCPHTYALVRQWVAIDPCGNYINGFQHIFFVDETAPVLTTGTIDPCYKLQSDAEAAALAATSATDACTTNPADFVWDVVTVGTCNAKITVTATDECENSTSFDYFTIIDGTAPVISCPPDVNGDCANDVPEVAADVAAFVAQGGSVSDNCDGYTTLTLTHIGDVLTPGTCVNKFSIARTYRITDCSGNYEECTQNIVINDNVKPTMACPAAVEVDCTGEIPAHATDYASFITAGGTVTDNCVGAIAVEFVSDVISNQTCDDRYIVTRTYKATDICGNEETCTQIITVYDDVKPLVSCPAGFEVKCAELVPTPYADYAEFVAAGGSASDNCSGSVTIMFVGDAISAQTCAHKYTITRTYRASDDCGNFEDCTQIITVNDDVKPLISCPAPETVACAFDVPAHATDYATFVAAGGTASDNCAGDVTVTFEGDVISAQTCPNQYTITRTYKATDVCGNFETCTQIITVNDDIDPLFTSPVDQEICSLPTGELYGLFDDATVVEPTAISDNCNGTVTFTYTITNGAYTYNGTNFITETTQFPIGDNYVEYTAADNCGNTTTHGFHVYVTKYQQAYAGPSQDWCGAANTVLLGNFPEPGYTPLWSLVSKEPNIGPDPVIFQQDNEAIADLLYSGVKYTFKYSLTNGPCYSEDTMTVMNWAAPTPALAGLDQELCNATTFTMTGNVAVVGQGTWAKVSGPACTYTDIHNPAMVVTAAVPGNYVFTWTIHNGICQDEVDEVQIINRPAVAISAGSDVITCPNYTTYTIIGATATAGTYSSILWTGGSGYFEDPSMVNPIYHPGTDDLANGFANLYMTAYGLGPCPAVTDMMVLTIQDITKPTTTVVGTSMDQNLNLNANCAVVIPNLIPNFTALNTQDNCTPFAQLTITQTPAAGTIVPSTHGATIPVTVNIVDLKGNAATPVVATMTAVDNTPVVITNCAALSQNVTLTSDCKITIPNIPAQVTVNENCAVLNKVMKIGSTVYNVGDQITSFHGNPTTITLTITDANPLNTPAVCQVTLTAVDATAPTISPVSTSPLSFNMNTTPNCTLTIPDLWSAVTWSDNCTYQTHSQNPAVGTVVAAHHNDLIPVAVTVTDLAGLQATTTVMIKAVDATAPVAVTPTFTYNVNTDPDLCSAVVTFPTPAFTDNCDFTVAQTAGLVSGSAFPKGANTVKFTATDNNNNVATVTITINVTDNQFPTISCQENITLNNDLGECGAVVTYSMPQAWDNCPGYTVSRTAGLASGANFPVGTTTVTYQVADLAGHTANCSFTVTVVDNEAPTFECPALIIVPNAEGECGTPTVTLTNPVAEDNCPGPVYYNAIEPEYYELGNNYVLWEVTDGLGNMSTCIQVVEIIDTELPLVDCPDDITVTIPVNQTYAVIPNIGQATATDNCWVATIYNDAPVNNQYEAGFNFVTWTAVDGVYNEGTCVQTIYVINPNYPAITCPGDVVRPNDLGACGAIVNNIDPTEVGGNGTTYTCTLSGATVSPVFAGTASGKFFNKGVTTVTYTAYNQYGPPATCSFTVTVNDVQPPSIQCPATKVVNVDAGLCQATILPSALGNPTVSDNCGGTINWVRSGIPANNIYPKGNTTITYTATDASGNIASCTQTVTVIDNIKPAFTFVPSNVSGFCDAGVCTKSGILFPNPATATDNCGGTVVVTSTGIITSGVYPRGVTNIVWTATDAAGNTATALTTVTVVDNQMPYIGNLATKTVNTDPGHCYATITGGIGAQGINPINFGDNCSYTLSYTMTGATVMSGTLLPTGNSFQFNKGTTSVTYIITDAQGNVASIPFSVIVNDVEKPVITVAQPTVTVNVDPGVCYATNVNLGNVTFTDNCGTTTPVITGIPVNGQYPKGTTTITYNVTDLSGNTATAVTQTVIVKDNVPPVFTSLPPATVTAFTNTGCTATGVNIGLANADDICDGEIYVYNNAPAAFPLGTTTIAWTATDFSGNQTTITTTVTVTDNVPPAISACAANKTIAANHAASGPNPAYYGPITQSWLGTPTATDNCGIASIVADIPFSGNFPVGTTNVLWIVTDNSGNTSTCIQTVTVTAYVPPVNQITGRLTYGNSIQTPMNNTTVTLLQDNAVVATTTTDQNGEYTFTDLASGNYTVNGDVNKPWGGGNATDALMILRHFTQMENLYNLPKYAADVNGNGYINSLDALLVAKRFIQQINAFPGGDWVTDNLAVNVEGYTLGDFLALCMGDVNGSYVPPSVKIPATVNLNNSGVQYINSYQEFELPVNVASELSTGAVSMVINYPSDLFDVTSVKMADPNIDNMMYNVNNGTIRLAWYTTDKLTLNSNEALLILKLKAKDLSHVNADVALTLDGVSEIADETGRVLDVNLTMPKLAVSSQPTSVSVFPNPFQNRTEFTYTLPEQAKVNIKIYDMLGNEVSTLVNETQNANTYQITFDASKLLAGVYTYKVCFTTTKGEEIRTGRLVITK